jgi:uncharacterized protein (DUF2236 family)
MTSTLQQRTAPPERANGFDVRRYLSYAGGLGGVANVIMQLSWPAVGYGVMESKVESGSAMKHPLKRARTTSTYLAVALLGSERDREVYRRAVDRQHAQVRSEPGRGVKYNAFSPRLQLWVAACLYYGLVDVLHRTQGPPDDSTADELYRYAARLGTTLQVRDEMWPADRRAFEAYWEESLAQVHIDDQVRRYLLGLVRLENLPPPIRNMGQRSMRFWTTGFLPAPFREEMGLDWSEQQQARFDQYLQLVGRVERVLPPIMKALPLHVMLLDMRLRHRAGLPLV